ncbi:decarboxylase [Nocardia higoensis]|uniref:decarboxylase n=1 Tax=Nocardia higoensis TaxID=228599 RepID=UPI0002FD0517|nr:decarboxylase [Nocardia higoensis]
MSAEPPALPALVSPLVREFLADRRALDAALARTGTPVHLIFPQVFAENVRAVRAVLEKAGARHRICYAHKVNQSRALARAARRAGIGIDVASPEELDSATAAGFAPADIEMTGPKGEAAIRRALRAGVTTNVDNLWELGLIDRITRMDRTTGPPAPVLLRVGELPGTPASRFGIPLARIDEALTALAAPGSRIELLGLAFHLDSGAVDDRVRAVQACLRLLERAHARGLAPTVIDIGGGLRQVFTADADRFDAYVRALRDGLAGRAAPLTWAGQTFGYHVEAGMAHGTPVFHKYGNTVTAPAMLAELLGAALPEHDHRPLARVLADNLLELWLEPGKALVDHAGITVAGVEFTKELGDGTPLVHLDISRDAVTPADQEVMVDPLVVPRSGPLTGPRAGVFFAGRLCLERDMVTTHRVHLPGLPRPGDLIVFPNTAAYHMDLSAASASMRPPPPKLAVVRTERGFRVHADTQPEPAPRDDIAAVREFSKET